jgi:Zn-dependent protease
MESSWRVGSLFGIPIFLDRSWFGIIILLTLLVGQSFYQDHGDWSAILAWSAGFCTALLLFVSVLLHELGHSLVALAQGIQVNSITLFLFGGIASIEEESKTPGQAFQVAIAGPVVSLGLFLLLNTLTSLLPSTNPSTVLINEVAHINLVLALFNLIPGLLLDGGQVLKSVIWKFTNSRFKGIHWAAKTGKVMGWLAMLLGLAVALITDELILGLWFILIGWFAVRNARNYERVTIVQELLMTLPVARAMTPYFRVLNANMTLKQFADQYLAEPKDCQAYYAASKGRYRGMVIVADLQDVERSLWDCQTLNDIVHPLPQIIAATEKTPLGQVINLMETEQLNWLTVLSPAGAVAGVVDRGDIAQTVAQNLNFAMTDVEIKSIRTHQEYPAGFQLHRIAKDIAEELAKKQ